MFQNEHQKHPKTRIMPRLEPTFPEEDTNSSDKEQIVNPFHSIDKEKDNRDDEDIMTTSQGSLYLPIVYGFCVFNLFGFSGKQFPDILPESFSTL